MTFGSFYLILAARRGLDSSEALRFAEPLSLDVPMHAARLICFSLALVSVYYSPSEQPRVTYSVPPSDSGLPMISSQWM